MFNFTLENPTKIHFGKGKIAKLSTELNKEQRILLTYGSGSIKQNGVYDQVMQALKGYQVFEFGGIEANPKFETLLKALPIIRENNIDFILAVGGGSVIDGTKFISAAINYAGDPWELLLGDPKLKTAMPFASILTLPATGSEMNCGAVISKTNSPDKLVLMHELLYPRFSILDPTTTYSLSDRQTANGIVDTFVHVTEQYITYPVNGALQDRFAEGILLTVIEEAAKVFLHPKDYSVRANLMWCSTWALNDFIAKGVPQDWATHRIGHELTARFGLDHGQTLAIVLPSMLNVKREQKHAKLLQYGERIWNIKTGTDEEKIDQAIAKTRAFFESVGVKTHLSDYGIDVSDIKDILAQLERHGLTSLGEHQDIDLKTSELILKGCF